MIQKLKQYLLIALTSLTFATPALVPAVAGAAAGCTDTITNGIATGGNGAAGSGSQIDCQTTQVGDSNITTLANKIVNIFSIIVGAVAVIMIIYGGFRYITSGGDSGRVGSAKNTLIYAVIGLIIVAVAQLIVHFVLGQTNEAVNP
jgi:hypothetical protein